MKTIRILVVNGFSSGMMIVGEAKRLGYECYHLATALEGMPEAYLRHNMASGYDGILEWKDSFEEQVKQCRSYRFDAVIPGSESGVIFAEKLADALSLPCNDASLSLARRDKYYMQKQLEEAGIPCIKSALVKSPQEAVDWYRANHMSGIVMKPRMDAGGLGFHLCNTEDEIRQAFAELFGRKSCFGEEIKTSDVLIQEVVSGTELVMNHVSHNGVHELTDAWIYDKQGAIYNHFELVTELSPVLCDVAKYTQKALNALGIKYGPSHSEIMLTEKGPVLIETGARLMGELMPRELIQRIFGYSIVEKSIQAYLRPVNSEEKLHSGYKFSDEKYYIMMMRSYRDERISEVPAEDLFLKCPNVVNIRLDELKESLTLQETTNMVNSPGVFGLIGKNADELAEWIRLYRMIEREHPHILFRPADGCSLTDEELQLTQRLIDL